MKTWRAWRQAGASEVARAAEAALVLSLSSAAVQLSPRRASGALVRSLSRRAGPAQVVQPVVLAQVARAVGRAERCIPRTTCLARAVAGWLMLKRRGIASSVRLGAGRDPSGALSAHAWLECDGVEIIGSNSDGQFVKFSSPA